MIPHLWSRRWFRFLVWSGLTLLTCCVLLYATVHWYGSRSWSRAQARLLQEGETLDFSTLLPAAVPDDQNFCALPLLKGLADSDEGSSDPTLAERRERVSKLKLTGGQGSYPNLNPTSSGSAISLIEWAAWLEPDAPKPADEAAAAQRVLAKLAALEPVVAELSTGLDRPHSQWTPVWKDRKLPELLLSVKLPHYESSMALTKPLLLHSAASLQAGKVEQAVQDLRILARLTEADLKDPFLIGQLVAAATAGLLADGVWTLCSSEKVSSEQCQVLSQELRRLDFMKSGLQSFRGELAAGVNAIQHLAIHTDDSFFQALGAEAGSLRGINALALPKGVFHWNAAELATLQLDYCIAPLRSGSWQDSLRKAQACDALLKERKGSWHMDAPHFMCQLIMPAMLNVVRGQSYAVARLKQAELACELAKHKLAKGSYPQTLAELGVTVTDPLSGYSLGYRLKSLGYETWSVGSDLQDDAGKKDPTPKRSPRDAKYKGDWLWTVP